MSRWAILACAVVACGRVEPDADAGANDASEEDACAAAFACADAWTFDEAPPPAPCPTTQPAPGAGCPLTRADDGTSCSLADGSACDYSAASCCTGAYAACTQGVWTGAPTQMCH